MNSKMNNKGFTLVEMLAVIVILAIIAGIATVSVISAINTSKLKSEQVFVDKLSNLIDDYLDLNKPIFAAEETYGVEFEKCSGYGENDENNECYKATAVPGKKTDGTSITLRDIVDAGIIEEEKLINPKNKEKCLDPFSDGPEIIVYRDKPDYVYYYYVDLTGDNTSCDISEENGIINTFPEELSQKIGLEE